jgi:plasmid stabilization system protein ParE
VKPAVFTPAAEADVEDAFQWYEAQRPGLGPAFRHAVDIAVAALEANPDAYAVVHRNTRRVLLPKFPYGLYYRFVDDQPVVVGCIHAKRHPRVWRSRGAG